MMKTTKPGYASAFGDRECMRITVSFFKGYSLSACLEWVSCSFLCFYRYVFPSRAITINEAQSLARAY